MPRRIVASSLSIAILIAASPAPAQDTGRAIRRGERIVTERCAMCHGTGPATTSPNPLAPPLRAIFKRYPAESLVESLQEGLVSAHPQMPTFVFSPGDTAAILSYLESIQAP